MEWIFILVVLGLVLYFMSSARRAFKQCDAGLNISLDKSEKKLVELHKLNGDMQQTHKEFEELLKSYK